MLGINIYTAVGWQHAASSDWMTYAADVSRRNPRNPQTSAAAARTILI